MGDPLSVAASTAGLLSLGIQVSQSLVSFYLTYQGQDADIERIAHKFKSLSDIFQSVGDAIKDRKFRPDEHALVVKIDDLIQDSGEIVIELREECSKFDKLLPNRLGAAVKTAGRRLTYPFRQSTFAKLDEDIKGIRDNLSLALDILSSRDSSRIQNDIQEIKALLDLVRISQVSNAVRDWLKAPDAAINYNEACAKRHPATGLWLVKSPTFTMWLERGNSFLWLNGFAGCGKSVLSSTAIQFAFRHRRSDPRIGIGFFYFTFNDNSKQDVSGMLRALLLQLSNQLDDGQSDLTRLHDKYRDGIPPVPVLMESLRRLVQKFQDVYIVVDALDESPRYDNRENVLNALTDFRNWSLNGLHILVTSRDEIDIREHLDPSSAEDIIMRNAGVDKDIEDCITGYLRQSRVLRKWSAYHLQIKEALIIGAKGVFRWVECQFKSVAACPRSEYHLEKLLTSLPQSLDETYERMLGKIDAASIEYARQILMWLCFAKRPLTVREVIDGVIVEPGDNPRVNLKRRLQDGDDILHICPGFIDVETFPDRTPRTYTQNNMARRVRITHYSVQEYLESDRIRQQTAAIFGIQSTTSNLEAAQICLVYLLDTTLSESKLTAAKLDKFPFVDYAAKNWYEHYKSGDGEGSPVDLLIMQLFGGQRVAFQNWIKIHDPDRHYSIYDFERDSDDIASPVYYASLLGLRRVLCGLLETKREGDAQTSKLQELSSSGVSSLVNAQGGEYGNALQAASLRGHEKIVQLLLDKGAEVNAQRGYLGNALQAASLGGHENIVQLLLDKGAAVNAQGGEYGNALQAASIECHEKVVQLLLDKGAAANAQGGRYGNTLQAASEAGHEKIVQLLLNNGAAVNAQGGRYGNALYAASVGGHEHVVQLLLDKGAAVNAHSGYRGDTLYAASLRGHEKVVQILLDESAAVNAQGGYYGNALQAASIECHEKVVRLLLDKGAAVNTQGGYYGNALQAASEGGHEKIVQLLLDKGAAVNAQGGSYGNALQAASTGGHEKVVWLLLNEAAAVNAQGGRYGNALQAASLGGHEKIVQSLLLKGAEVNAHGGYFDNALQAASFGGHEKIVQVLLLKGAEVNTHGGYFSSALQAASVRGHEKVVQLLLDEGAKVNAQGGEYGSALQAASAGGHEDIVELLEKAKLLQIGCSSA